MVSGPMAPGHYLNECCLIIRKNSSDIDIWEISKEMPQPQITKICLKITYLKLHLHFPGANELKTRSPIQIHKIQYLIYNHLTHSSKAILDDTKGNWGFHSVNVTSQWLLHNATLESWGLVTRHWGPHLSVDQLFEKRKPKHGTYLQKNVKLMHFPFHFCIHSFNIFSLTYSQIFISIHALKLKT